MTTRGEKNSNIILVAAVYVSYLPTTAMIMLSTIALEVSPSFCKIEAIMQACTNTYSTSHDHISKMYITMCIVNIHLAMAS